MVWTWAIERHGADDPRPAPLHRRRPLLSWRPWEDRPCVDVEGSGDKEDFLREPGMLCLVQEAALSHGYL